MSIFYAPDSIHRSQTEISFFGNITIFPNRSQILSSLNKFLRYSCPALCGFLSTRFFARSPNLFPLQVFLFCRRRPSLLRQKDFSNNLQSSKSSFPLHTPIWQPLVNLNSYASMKAMLVDRLMISVDQTNLSLEWQGRGSQVRIVELVGFRALFEEFSNFQPEKQVYISYAV